MQSSTTKRGMHGGSISKVSNIYCVYIQFLLTLKLFGIVF